MCIVDNIKILFMIDKLIYSGHNKCLNIKFNYII